MEKTENLLEVSHRIFYVVTLVNSDEVGAILFILLINVLFNID